MSKGKSTTRRGYAAEKKHGSEDPPLQELELEPESELDGAGAADLIEGVEAAVGAAGAQAVGQRLRRVADQGAG